MQINEWAGYGGGIGNSGGAVSIVKSAITENTLEYLGIGAGIYNDRGTLILRDSTVAGNSAATSGGGIYNAGELQIEGVTVARNDAQNITVAGGENGLREFPVGCRIDHLAGCISGGGGIWNEGAGTVRSGRSVIGLNTQAFDRDLQFGPDCRGTVKSNGYTAIGDSADCRLIRAPGLPRRSTDKVGIDPGLGDLEDNADAGYAHLPVLANSPLIDAGGKISQLCSPRDQIGQPRRDGDGNDAVRCDIGAIEYQP
jgi:predicted outer membrane repeat protein